MTDPDLQIRGEPGHPGPEIRGGGFSKNFFSAVRVSVWSKNKGALPWIRHCSKNSWNWPQLFRERLSEKKCTILKGIVGGFEFTVLYRNLKEWHERPWTYVCECLRKAEIVSSSYSYSYSVRNSVLIISHITFRDCRVHIFSGNLSRNSRML